MAGCPSERLFFTDLLRLLTDEHGRGVGKRAGVAKRRVTLAEAGKSFTMSDLVLETEAKLAQEAGMDSKPKIFARGRSVQNLSRFVKRALPFPTAPW